MKQNLCHFLPAPIFSSTAYIDLQLYTISLTAFEAEFVLFLARFIFSSAAYTDLQLYTLSYTTFEAEFVPILARPNLLLASIHRFTTIYYTKYHIWSRYFAISCLSLYSSRQHTLIYNYYHITYHIWSRICAISCPTKSSPRQHTLIYNYILYHIPHLKQNLCHFLPALIFSWAADTFEAELVPFLACPNFLLGSILRFPTIYYITYHIWSRIVPLFADPSLLGSIHWFTTIYYITCHIWSRICAISCPPQSSPRQHSLIYNYILDHIGTFLARPNLLHGSIHWFTTIYFITYHIWSRICAISCPPQYSTRQHTLIYYYILYHVPHVKQNLCHFLPDQIVH